MSRSVLFVIGDLGIGGAERHLVQVLPALARTGVHPTVHTLTHKGQLAPLLEEQGIRVIAPPLSSLARRLPRSLRRPIILPLSAASLLFTLFSDRPQVVHFFLPAAYLLGGLMSLLVPVGSRVMSRRSLRNYQQGYPRLASVERWLHSRMTAVLGNSRAVVAELREEGVSEDRLGLLYNGIDTRPYRSLPPRAELRRRLGLAESALVMVKVANLIPYKGHADLLVALPRIKEQLPAPWVLLLVGKGSAAHEETLQALTTRLGLNSHVRFLGERTDLPEILGAADIGILCSHQEGFSNSVLEGMAAGLPMVVTSVGGNPEAIVDGESGIVVPPHNPDALAKAILDLATDAEARSRMGDAGRRRLEARFSLDACVGKYQALYEGLIDHRSGTVSELIDRALGMEG